MNFIHSEAVERGENRSLQCLIVCICWGGSKESERGFRRSERRKTMQTHAAQNILFTPCNQKSAGFRRTIGSLAPLKAMSCLHWEVGFFFFYQCFHQWMNCLCEWENHTGGLLSAMNSWDPIVFGRTGTSLCKVNTVRQDKECWYSRHIKETSARHSRMLWCVISPVVVCTASYDSQFTTLSGFWTLKPVCVRKEGFWKVSGWSSGI